MPERSATGRGWVSVRELREWMEQRVRDARIQRGEEHHDQWRMGFHEGEEALAEDILSWLEEEGR